MHRLARLPHLIWFLLTRLRAAPVRARQDGGVTTLEVVIYAALLAALALFVAGAITGKVHDWVNQIPG